MDIDCRNRYIIVKKRQNQYQKPCSKFLFHTLYLTFLKHFYFACSAHCSTSWLIQQPILKRNKKRKELLQESAARILIPLQLSLRSLWACSLKGYSANSPELYKYSEMLCHHTTVPYFSASLFILFGKFCFAFQVCDEVMEGFCCCHVLIFPFNIGDNRVIIFFCIAEQIGFACSIFPIFV